MSLRGLQDWAKTAPAEAARGVRGQLHLCHSHPTQGWVSQGPCSSSCVWGKRRVLWFSQTSPIALCMRSHTPPVPGQIRLQSNLHHCERKFREHLPRISGCFRSQTLQLSCVYTNAVMPLPAWVLSPQPVTIFPGATTYCNPASAFFKWYIGYLIAARSHSL